MLFSPLVSLYRTPLILPFTFSLSAAGTSLPGQDKLFGERMKNFRRRPGRRTAKKTTSSHLLYVIATKTNQLPTILLLKCVRRYHDTELLQRIADTVTANRKWNGNPDNFAKLSLLLIIHIHYTGVSIVGEKTDRCDTVVTHTRRRQFHTRHRCSPRDTCNDTWPSRRRRETRQASRRHRFDTDYPT